MWVIAIAAGLISAAGALAIVKVGHKVYMSIKREEEAFNVEKEAYEKIKEDIKEEK